MNNKVRKQVTWSCEDFELSHEPVGDSIEVEETVIGFIVKYLVQDDNAENPFLNWDGEGKIIFNSESSYVCNKDVNFEKAIKHKYAVVLDAYIHSGIALSVSGGGVQCQWDTSHNIAVWVPDEDCSIKSKKQAIKCAEQACNLFNQYANGDVYGCCVDRYDKDKHYIDGDSVWGYFGYDDAKELLKNEF